MTTQEDQDRLAPRCDHKFVDSGACLKCGWTPPPAQNFIASLQQELANLRQIATEYDAEIGRLKAEIAEARVLCGADMLQDEPDACLATLVNRSRLRAEALRTEVERLQSQLDGWHYTDIKALRAEIARLKAGVRALPTIMPSDLSPQELDRRNGEYIYRDAVIELIDPST